MKRILSAAFALIILLSFCAMPVAADDMPDWWYPDGTENFKNFHGTDLPRVVDDADVLTDEQEAELSEVIQYIVNTYGIGYVIFTDTDNHGLSQEVYSADFLYSNGYGVGNDYSAVVFYLSLEPGNRGWRTTSINGCEQIFTADVTYQIDEIVDDDIRNKGDYYTAFKKHVVFVNDLMASLTTDRPDWYPDNVGYLDYADEDECLSDKLDISKPRVVDNAGYFTAEQKARYTETLNKIAEKYKYDVVIFTDSKRHATSNGRYADDYYCYNNRYKDGTVFYMISDPLDSDSFYYGYIGYGEFYDKYGEKNIIAEMGDTDGTAAQTADDFIEKLDYLLEHGRFPISADDVMHILFAVVIGLVIGCIVSAIRLQSLKRKMRVSRPISAGVYLVPESFRLRDRSVDYLYTTVTRVAKPKNNGGSSGGSSFSSGSSSGGGSFSSGGRNF